MNGLQEREPAFYEYMIVESGEPVEEAWQIVGVYGGQVFRWMVFRRYIGNSPDLLPEGPNPNNTKEK